MGRPERLTEPFVDIVEAFWRAQDALHGYEIKKRTKRTGPTVYNNLDRLKELGWIVGAWETRNPEPGRPPRRVYHLTPSGRAEAEKLLINAGRIKAQGGFNPVPRGGDL